MKILFVLLGMISPGAALAAEVSCMNDSNGDYYLHLATDDNGTIRQITLVNEDWGKAGEGEAQEVRKDAGSQYTVTGASGKMVQVDVGAKMTVKSEGKKITAVELSSPRSTLKDSYHCF